MSARILIVEDNPDSMKLINWALEDEGYELTGASSAEEGLALLEEHVFDLLLLDISLPGMDGKEATMRLRSDPRFFDLPIVAVTAHAIRQEASIIRACGVDEMLTKPIDESRLLVTVEALLRERVDDGQDTGS